ncbi:hypothetical protein [Methylocaldum gracile]|jgi:hypothetical protein|nr:hypothetical protein [Methylocaldum sp. BRCS4]
MSDEQEYTRFAIALGMASFQAQSLEHSLVSLFAATSALEPEAVRKLMDTRYNQTLGKLVRDAAKDLQLSTELTMELEDALQKRNWVTHHFFREYGAVALSSSLLHEATQRLEAIWPMFEKTANNVHQLVIDQQVRSGRSTEQIQAGIERALKMYLSEKGHT